MTLEKKLALVNQREIDKKGFGHTELYSKELKFDWKQVWGDLPGGDFGG